ncbi:hypothetical protein L2E82_00027 [Cichorium intybus]|uniref:Uncharacterized protein n=1 Tax=Cichorium intybus TaxID=13427 RepID=A0ACB9GXD0_CICIN|nr:hypothetical protein L2E82_00027 [Cichorium intybus]
MHVAEIGEGPAVLFIHGFPELWYTWRHQMLYISSKGYRAIAPDLRGFGDSEAPPSSASYTVFHIVGDLVCLLDSLGPDQGLVNMSVVYQPRNPSVKPVEVMRQTFGDDFYICRFQRMMVAAWKEDAVVIGEEKDCGDEGNYGIENFQL